MFVFLPFVVTHAHGARPKPLSSCSFARITGSVIARLRRAKLADLIFYFPAIIRRCRPIVGSETIGHDSGSLVINEFPTNLRDPQFPLKGPPTWTDHAVANSLERIID